VWGNLTEKVADLREKDVAHVEKVECTTSEGLCQRMNLAGYPSVVVFRNGKRGEMYQGSRSLEDLERFVRAKAASDAPVAVAGDSHDESHEDNTVEDEEIEEEHAEEDKGEDHDPEEEAAPPVPVPIPPAVPAVPPPKPAREAPPKHEQPKPAAEAPRHEQPNRKSDLPKVIREDIQRTCDKLYKSETPMAPSDGKAKMLTAASFDELVKTGSTFVKFYAPWCGHCQRLQPTWESLANHPKIQGKVNIGKVDCTVEHQLCRRFGVKSFPQLKFFQKNDVVDFRGARTTEGLVAFSHAQLDVPLQPLHALELREAMKSHDLHFVLLYSRYEAAVDVMVSVV
jgi:protein disulfide-isomerase-like protein